VSVVCCAASGFCEGLIICSEEFYRVYVSVCDVETSTARRPRPIVGCRLAENKISAKESKMIEIKFFLYVTPGYYTARHCRFVSRTNGLLRRIRVVLFLKKLNETKLHIILHRAKICVF
jgi:hypothetical protein